MTNSPIRTVEKLKNEIEKTKQTLVETDETIKKITGRDGVENRPIRNNNDSFDHRLSRYEGRSALTLNRKRLNSSTHIGLDRRISRNFDDEDIFETSRMSVASSVVATSGLAKSREDIIEQQNKDKESNARNKRMFGLLMGTLASFKTDGGKNERQEKKRREIEKRLEEREKMEKEQAKKQRQELFSNKKQNELKLRRLQLKMDLVQLHEEWEEQSQQLTNFIRTDAKPNIYYLPKVHNKASLEKLDKSKKLIEAVVAKRRKLLDEELKHILEGKKDEDEEEEDDDDAPPRKQAKKTEKQTAEENEGVDSEAEIDKNIREDFQISAVDEVVVGGVDVVVEKKVVVEGEDDDGEGGVKVEVEDAGKVKESDEGSKDADKEEEEKVEKEEKDEEMETDDDNKDNDLSKEVELKAVKSEDNDDDVSNHSSKEDDEMVKSNDDGDDKVDNDDDEAEKENK